MDGNAFATAASAAVGLELVGGLLLALGSNARKGTLPRNTSYGIRTKVTRASDAAWAAGHTAVAGACLGLGAFCVLAGIVLIVAGFVTSPGFVVVAMLVGYGVLLVGMAGCTIVANRAGRAAHVSTPRVTRRTPGGRRASR